MKVKKCEYCNVNMNATCHGHKVGCPYSCNTEQPQPQPKPQGSLPIGGLDCLFGFISIFLIYKFIKLFK